MKAGGLPLMPLAEDPQPVSGRELRDVMGDFATGVTIVTARSADGELMGFTANAVTSVSLAPPLVLVCIGKDRQAHDQLLDAPFFALNILAHEQEWLAKRFASPIEDRFATIERRDGAFGPPRLEGSLAGVECQLVQVHDGGDHAIVVGRVCATWRSEGAPLLFLRGAFRHLAAMNSAEQWQSRHEWMFW